MKEWLQEREEILVEIAEAYEVEWNGHNHVGNLTEKAWGLLHEIQMTMPEAFRYPEDLPQYWDVGDWFMDGPPEPEKRDVEFLVENARNMGAHLEPDEVKEYLKELTEEEELEKIQGTLEENSLLH